METITKNYIKNILPKRQKNSHKGTYGKVLIIAGSKGMAGAAVLSARGALRSGAGLVRVSAERELFPIIQNGVIEATCVSREIRIEDLKGYDSIVIGPGLGTGNQGISDVVRVMENYGGKVVMDADALNIIAENKMDLKKTAADIIITPHPGEAARLTGKSTNEVNENREQTVSLLSRSTDTVSVLKGYETLICLPGTPMDKKEKIYLNPVGNPGMATGGSGDVLSGIIGSLAGQGMSSGNSALAGVYIHGLAGDLAAYELGEYGVTAGDIAKYTAYAIKNILKG